MATGRDVAEWLGADLSGPDRPVARIAEPESAGGDAVVVVSRATDMERLGERRVAVVVGPPEVNAGDLPYISVASPRLALALLTARFDHRPVLEGVAPEAHVHPEAELGHGVAVGPGAVLGRRARVGSGTVIGPGCILGDGATIGADSLLHANVTIYDDVRIGDRALLHGGCVLGADGFGFAAGPQGAVKIHHLGGVRIGDDVEIGANTCVDRGTLRDTSIGDRTKIDNLCQIGHNASIGSDVLIAGMTGIGGSAHVGDRVTIAGYVGIADHVRIGEGATIGARSGVHKDVPAGETWIGAPAMPHRAFARSLYLQRKLEEIWAFVKERA